MFLKYSKNWEENVEGNTNLSADERNRMMLSREALEGIRITSNFIIIINRLTEFIFLATSFIEMTKYLLAQGNDLFLLSERISQDPLENYFGQQRARGRKNENPTVQQCLYNTAALRVQKSQALDPIRGHCSRKKRLVEDNPPAIDETPLLKRKCYQKPK